jgi:ribonuclease P protein component
MDHSWSKSKRICRSREFKRIQSHGRQWKCKYFIVKMLPSSCTRIGLTVSKRVGCAPIRNKIKRLFREILRRRELPLNKDLVFIAYTAARNVSYQDLKHEIDRLFYRLENKEQR